MVIWIKDAPKFGVSSAEELLLFIDNHITTRIPDPVLEPDAFQLVSTCQLHASPCPTTCLERPKKGEGKGKRLKSCRFGFPKTPQPHTVLTKEGDISVVDDSRRLYLIRRADNAQYINQYNLPILMAWRGNIDIQFVGHHSNDNVDYVTGYVTKPESKLLNDNTLLAERLSKSGQYALAGVGFELFYGFAECLT